MHETVPIRGHIEGICGCMFCGKTTELLRRIERARIAGLKVQLFKPLLDDRDGNEIVARNGGCLPCSLVKNTAELFNRIENDTDIVGLDEVQFFDPAIVAACNEMANGGIRVIWSGLDLDFRGMPFASVPALLAISEYVTKLSAICTYEGCGGSASRSQRLDSSKELLSVGHYYAARCRHHHNIK